MATRDGPHISAIATRCKLGSKDGKCMSDKAINELLNRFNIDTSYRNKYPKLYKLIQVYTEDATPIKLSEQQLAIITADGSAEILGDSYTDELLRFKPFGPIGNDYFNNFALNNANKQIEVWLPNYYAIDCLLYDFMDHDNKLTQMNPRIFFDDNKNCFGCILNTLESSGNLNKVGHWVALFGDFRASSQNTIEYYNSSGQPASPKLFAWMESKAAEFQQYSNIKTIALNTSNVVSQRGGTECGIYSFHYILCRAMGIDYKRFREHRVTDEDVNKVRKFIFNDERQLPGTAKTQLRNKMLL